MKKYSKYFEIAVLVVVAAISFATILFHLGPPRSFRITARSFLGQRGPH